MRRLALHRRIWPKVPAEWLKNDQTACQRQADISIPLLVRPEHSPPPARSRDRVLAGSLGHRRIQSDWRRGQPEQFTARERRRVRLQQYTASNLHSDQRFEEPNGSGTGVRNLAQQSGSRVRNHTFVLDLRDDVDQGSHQERAFGRPPAMNRRAHEPQRSHHLVRLAGAACQSTA